MLAPLWDAGVEQVRERAGNGGCAGGAGNGRRKTDLRVMWTVKTRLVDKTLSLRSVKAGSPPALAPTPPPTGIQVASPVTQGSQDATVPQDGGQPPLPLAPPTTMTGLPPPSSQVTPSPSIGAHAGDPASHASAATLTTTTAHGLTWTAGAVEQPVGGPVARRSWSVRTLPEEVIFEDGDALLPRTTRTPYKYFLTTFPM